MEGAIPSKALPESFTSHRRTGKANMYLQQLIEQSQSAIANWESQIAELQGELPDTNRLGGMVLASQFISNCLYSRRLTPKPLWSYIASKGSSVSS